MRLKASSLVWADFMLPKTKRNSFHIARLGALFKRLAASRSRTRPELAERAEPDPMDADPMAALLGGAGDETEDDEMEAAVDAGQEKALCRKRKKWICQGKRKAEEGSGPFRREVGC